MEEFQETLNTMAEYEAFAEWAKVLPECLNNNVKLLKHGDLDKWKQAVTSLPKTNVELSYELADTIKIGRESELNEQEKTELESQLKQLCPWRKGPYNFFGLEIDTEWRSDWKWQRLAKHIDSLQDHLVLDVGCGSGYHLWRMREAGAAFVLGIDPSLLFWQQFLCAKNYLNHEPVHYLPLRAEDLPERLSAFDTVFSMGVLYHRRSPLDHFVELRSALKPKGQLVLETLVIEKSGQNILFPSDRYAMMRNVFFLPSVELLQQWLERCGFIDVEIINLNQTSTDEQRVTDWVKAKSLKDFLDPNDPNLTVEGYPAPLRVCVKAYKDPKFT
jgi:tRNA (mo5U34)-methyltransferase